LIAVDADGIVRDGDDLLAIFATDFVQRGVELPGVVLTTMSNWGLRRALEAEGLEVVETDVGDRHVLFAMEERGWPLGGEQSGHLIFADYSPTGDGLLTGLLLADLVARRGSLHHLADGSWHRVPQRLVNIPKDHYDEELTHSVIAAALANFSLSADDVRVIIRPSGTEPVVRVMIEAELRDLVDGVCDDLLAQHANR
jgi:phosphoglucosamine mutase